MTPPPLEHDYIGLSEVSSNGSTTTAASDKLTNLKQTELRLGLPGSESPNRVTGSDLTLGINTHKPTFGGGGGGSAPKRGFSDALDGPANTNKWVFNSGSEVELFSPKKGDNNNTTSSSNNNNNNTLGGVGVKDSEKNKAQANSAPPAKAQVVGWPPIRSYRKNTMATTNTNQSKNKEDGEGKQGAGGCLYVKVSMDGAPYLRKVDLKTYSNYKELSSALENMFSCFTIGQFGSHGMPAKDGLSESRMTELIDRSENVLTYEDKDGDWMLVGDVPWEMFTETCRRLRIMKGSDAIGLAPRVSGKSKNWN